ncbi:MAG: hypothetical protein KDA49_06390 [Rhodospirillaceae bacterium]|nr:hypothetical protein [Rhodospirillaceae bacterium]
MLTDLATDAVFESDLALEGTYTPAAGAPVVVRVLRSAPTIEMSMGAVPISVDTTVFRVRASEVPAPASCDTLSVDGAGYVLQGAQKRSQSGAVWTLDTRPA